MALKISNILNANRIIEGAEQVLHPALEQSGIKTISVDGKTLAYADAPLAAQIAALLAANPVGVGSQQVSDVLVSNDLISKELEQTKTDLAIAQTSVATLTREKAALEGQLTAAQASVQSLTAEKADLNNRLQAAVNQFTANAKEIAAQHLAVARQCLKHGSVEFKGSAGKAMTADASDEALAAAANGMTFTELLTADNGAVNHALTRTGVNVATLPSGGTSTGNQPSVADAALVAQLEAIKDPAERARFRIANASALFRAAQALK